MTERCGRRPETTAAAALPYPRIPALPRRGRVARRHEPERFDWLTNGSRIRDIIRTPGTESNVKEIYDKCAELARTSAT
jgi:hypothetical protein